MTAESATVGGEVETAVLEVGDRELFTTYMSLYIRLDESMWQAIGLLGVALGLGFNFVGQVESQQIAIWPLTHRQTVAVGLLSMAILMSLVTASLKRIRQDSAKLVSAMRSVEPKEGFFSYRATKIGAVELAETSAASKDPDPFAFRSWIRQPGKSATVTYFWTFRLTAYVLAILSVLQFLPA